MPGRCGQNMLHSNKTKIGYACDQNCDSVLIGTCRVETDKVQWEESNKIYLWYYAPGMHVTIEL